MISKTLVKRVHSSTLTVNAFNDLEVECADSDFYALLNLSEDDFKMIFDNKFLNIIDINSRTDFLKFLIDTTKPRVFDLDVYSLSTGKISISIVAMPINDINLDEKNFRFFLTIFSKNVDYDKFEEMKIENSICNRFFELRNICVYIIDKETYEILYFNDLLKKLMPNLKIGDVCYKTNGYDEPCKKCYLKEPYSYSSEFLFSGDKDWIVTTSSILWKNGKEAYVIYGKNAVYNFEELNTKDFLTGASTIISFKSNFNNLIYNKSYALISLDIEKFKYINNIWGNIVGDEILKRLSKCIANFLKRDELFCRVNDDKFLILIHYKTEQQLEEKLNVLRLVFENMKDEYFKYMSVNIVCGVCKVSNKTSFDTLLDMANIAKISVKGNLNKTFKIYDDELQNKFIKQSLIHERLKSAIKNNEFIPYIQPKFNLITNEIYGAEALVRWKSFDRMIYPDEFIPIFEKNGFITKLDFIIYEQVFKFIRKCINEGIKLVPISLNASREHVLDREVDFIENLFVLINKYDIPLSLVEIEITENAFMGDKDLLKNFVDDLRNTGIKVSIDDFGSAYSSLNSLKDIEVDIIKLDKAFLCTLESIKITDLPNKDKIIVANVVRLTKELKLNIVCEGVETEDQLEFLREIGCEHGQGYLFSKPLPINDFKELFLENLKNSL